MRTIVAAALTAALLTGAGAQEKKDEDKTADELLADIEKAAGAKDYSRMIKLAELAEKKDAKNPAIPFALGSACAALRKHAQAVDAFKKATALAPKSSVAHDRLGDAYFKNGQAAEAVDSFNKSIELIEGEGERKKVKANHWRLGLALYYAGKHKDGADQFNAATDDAREDVENSVWHYLCNARAIGKDEARKKLIPVTKDSRIPMGKIYEMFAGKCDPAAVLTEVAAKKLTGEPLKEANFYAHLYIALFYESEGGEDGTKKCKDHLMLAIGKDENEEKTKVISHYMWDVAKMHQKKLEAAKKPEEKPKP